MHIEPGIVTGAKALLGFATAVGAAGYSGSLAWQAFKERGGASLAMGAATCTALTFVFFEVLPHYPVGVSEVHLILGSTLFLLFGVAPAALGLALGLLIQGTFFAPFDLPQYDMNLTTLLVPLVGLRMVARQIIAADTRYVDLKYWQALTLSTIYQGGIVFWVAFWAIYGGGFTAANVGAVFTFGASYFVVVLLEPLIDLAVLALAKWVDARKWNLFSRRLYAPA